jgi:hypothetical protein
MILYRQYSEVAQKQAKLKRSWDTWSATGCLIRAKIRNMSFPSLRKCEWGFEDNIW